MENLIVWFEIPVSNMDRAKKFYTDILGLEIHIDKIGEHEMGFFSMKEFSVSGALIKGPQFEPSAKGTVVYLNGGDDLQNVLDKVKPAGGKIIMPKEKLPEDFGNAAHFQDTEGNIIGLWSKN